MAFLGQQREDYPVAMIEDVVNEIVNERAKIFRQIDLLLPQLVTAKIIHPGVN